jgi:DNA topoisomerase-1
VFRTPEQLRPYLSPEQLALYTLIWQRLLASQMQAAVLDHTTVDIQAKHYLFRATGSVVRFAGFTTVYEESEPETSPQDAEAGSVNPTLPPLAVCQDVHVQAVVPNQHFTQPPPRFSEASLVQELEKLGIGRPSTYATILGTLRDRQYVQDQERRFVPTELGKTVNALLVQSFPDILDVEFTAQLEDKLDKIEEGTYDWVETLQNFYDPFVADLQQAASTMRDVKKEVEPTDEVCDKCQQPMVIRWGRFGRFMACSGFPACKNTRELVSENGVSPTTTPTVNDTCDTCGRPMVLKRGRYGEFLACSGFPDCKTTKPAAVVMACPESSCTGHIVARKSRRGRTFYGCTNYPRCTFSVWQRPVSKVCPLCQAPYLLEKRGKNAQSVTLRCATQGCSHTETGDTASVA